MLTYLEERKELTLKQMLTINAAYDQGQLSEEKYFELKTHYENRLAQIEAEIEEQKGREAARLLEEEYENKKKVRAGVISTIIGVVLLALFVVGIVFMVKYHFEGLHLDHLEYEAQIAANGIFKEDLHVLDQLYARHWLSVKWSLSTASMLIGLFGMGINPVAYAFVMDK